MRSKRPRSYLDPFMPDEKPMRVVIWRVEVFHIELTWRVDDGSLVL